MGEIYIVENKSVAAYLRQLEKMGEDAEDYASIWGYTHGQTEPRFGLYDHTFENADDFIAFSQAACAYVIKTVQEGWKEKDEVDWTVFNLKSNNDEKVD